MNRPIVAIVALTFAVGAAALCAPFLMAAVRHPSSQDTPVWLALGISAALSSALAIWSCLSRVALNIKSLAIRALLCITLVLPAALLLGAFSSVPP